MADVALAWLVLDLTGSPVRLGLAMTMRFGPTLVLSLFGGLLADRLPKRLLLMTDAVRSDGAVSDIDLIGIGAATLRELAAALAPVAREAGRELNASAFSAEEFRDRYRTGRHLVVSVVEGRKLWLIGDQSELERLVG